MDNHEKLVRDFLSVTKTESAFLDGMKPFAEQMMGTTGDILMSADDVFGGAPIEEVMKVAKEVQGSFLDEIIKVRKALIEVLVDIYKEAFSPKELRDLIAFYKTTTGQKAVDVMPGVMTKIAGSKKFGRILSKAFNKVNLEEITG